jgi:hypothetical protein
VNPQYPLLAPPPPELPPPKLPPPELLPPPKLPPLELKNPPPLDVDDELLVILGVSCRYTCRNAQYSHSSVTSTNPVVSSVAARSVSRVVEHVRCPHCSHLR